MVRRGGFKCILINADDEEFHKGRRKLRTTRGEGAKRRGGRRRRRATRKCRKRAHISRQHYKKAKNFCIFYREKKRPHTIVGTTIKYLCLHVTHMLAQQRFSHKLKLHNLNTVPQISGIMLYSLHFYLKSLFFVPISKRSFLNLFLNFCLNQNSIPKRGDAMRYCKLLE